ncbi:MAG: hypothetical protein PUB18_04675, partial [bacterium]|nr:hypothetical protein [bacterium]
VVEGAIGYSGTNMDRNTPSEIRKEDQGRKVFIDSTNPSLSRILGKCVHCAICKDIVKIQLVFII